LIPALAEIPFRLGIFILFFFPFFFRRKVKVRDKFKEKGSDDSKYGGLIRERIDSFDYIRFDVTAKWKFENLFSGSLQITNSEEEDQGKYECVAENSLGIEISNVSTLHVRGEIS
jgi:hypothetical protein